MTNCPVCATGDPIITVRRDLLPSMQNYVYRTASDAAAARRGRLALAMCARCGFAWNAAFDPSLLEYDSGYDNAVPSAVMDRHYRDLAAQLGRRYGLDGGYIVDVGCGNGTFLDAVCEVWPGCRALGVDPALPGDEIRQGGRMTLVKGVFSARLLTQTPSLFVLRHVLEHIPRPVEFVQELRIAMGEVSGVPLYVEVPDLEWIVDNGAFWDFCHEHCNYFTAASLGGVLARAGFHPSETGVTFGRQYRWTASVTASPAIPGSPDRAIIDRLDTYAASERDRVNAIRDRLRALRASGAAVVIWGMATKGIMFSLMVDPESALIDFSVDVNENKQECFVPISGRRIESPQVLRHAGSRPLAVVVMNPNYLNEIAGMCRAMNVSPEFLDATGASLVAA